MLLIPWIYRLFPNHKFYAEPFAGFLGVLLNKHRSKNSEAANDLDGIVINLMRVIANPQTAAQLKERLAGAIPTESLYQRCAAYLAKAVGKAAPSEPDVDLAFARLYVACYGWSAHWTSAKMPGRGSPKPLPGPDRIDALTARLRYVRFFQRDAIAFIQAFDGPDSFFYIDPPYSAVSSTKQYMSDHGKRLVEALVDTLKNLKGKFLLSGYPNPIYDKCGWERRQRIRTRFMNQGIKAPHVVETFWANYSLNPALDMVRLDRWWNKEAIADVG